MLDLSPSASVGHVGLYRDPVTLEAIEYYYKVPKDMGQRLTIVVDPMLATGHTAVAALDRLTKDGAREISFVCLVAAPEGLAELTRPPPDVPIFAAAVDEQLTQHGYNVPGPADPGHRHLG